MSTETSRRKPGPIPKGYKRHNIFLPLDLAEWAKQQPNGMSELIRRLLAEARQQLDASSASP
jgi:hypothetical protein